MPAPRAAIVVALLSVAYCMAGPAAGQSDDWTLQRLMGAMAGRTEATARFTEERHLHYLDAPIRVEGELVYRAPLHLEKRILRPEQEFVTIDGDNLTIETPGSGTSTSARVSDYPVLRTLITGIHTIMAGDLETLQRVYSIEYRNEGTEWLILLSPRDEDVRGTIQEFRLGGNADKISLVQITESNGNRTIMHVTPDP